MIERTVEIIRKELYRAEDDMYRAQDDRDQVRSWLIQRQDFYERAQKVVNDLRTELEVEEARVGELEALRNRVADLKKQLKENRD